MIKRRINTQTEAEHTARLEKIKGMEWGKKEPAPKIDPRIADGKDLYTVPNHGRPFRGAPNSATVTRQIADRKLAGDTVVSTPEWGSREMKQEIETQRQVQESGEQSEWEEFQEFKRQKAEAEAVKETIPTILPNDPDLEVEPAVETVVTKSTIPEKKYSSHVQKLINIGTLNESVAEALYDQLKRPVTKADLNG